MNKIAWIILGGGLGAASRYLIAGSDWLKMENGFPLGTFLVNLLGCLLIGFVWQAVQGHSTLSPLLVIGFLGGFTTFSSFGLESQQLFEAQSFKILTAYVLLSNILGISLVYIGHSLAGLLHLNAYNS